MPGVVFQRLRPRQNRWELLRGFSGQYSACHVNRYPARERGERKNSLLFLVLRPRRILFLDVKASNEPSVILGSPGSPARPKLIR